MSVHLFFFLVSGKLVELFTNPSSSFLPLFLTLLCLLLVVPLLFTVWNAKVLQKGKRDILPFFIFINTFFHQRAVCAQHCTRITKTIYILEIDLAGEAADWNSVLSCEDNKGTVQVVLPLFTPDTVILRCTQRNQPIGQLLIDIQVKDVFYLLKSLICFNRLYIFHCKPRGSKLVLI